MLRVTLRRHFFVAAEHIRDSKTVKFKRNAELFLKLVHHCAKHNAISNQRGVLMAPNTDVFVVDGINVYLSSHR